MSSTSHLLAFLIITIPVVIHALHRSMDVDGCILASVWLKSEIDTLHIHTYFNSVKQYFRV